MASTLKITGLVHDALAQKSYINFVWADDPGKRLGLEVPYGLPLDQAASAARQAIDALSSELAGCTIEMT